MGYTATYGGLKTTSMVHGMMGCGCYARTQGSSGLDDGQSTGSQVKATIRYMFHCSILSGVIIPT